MGALGGEGVAGLRRDPTAGPARLGSAQPCGSRRVAIHTAGCVATECRRVILGVDVVGIPSLTTAIMKSDTANRKPASANRLRSEYPAACYYRLTDFAPVAYN